MTSRGRTIWSVTLAAVAGAWATRSGAEPLTADRAVQIALQHSSQVIGARAGVLEARSGLYSAYRGALPTLTGSVTESADHFKGSPPRFINGGIVTSGTFTRLQPSVSTNWNVLDLSALTGIGAGKAGVNAAQQRVTATRADVALAVRRQFYQVVSATQLAEVSSDALRLARDDERRVRALFEVGSVSRSDVLKAQVATAQAELDSVTQHQDVINQRITLASQVGVPESGLPEVDTTLTVEPREYDEGALLTEAGRARPDIRAAEADLRAAKSSLTSARLNRLPYINVSGQALFSQKSKFTGTPSSTTDREYLGSVSVNWDLFDGLATDAGIASSRARVIRGQDALDALKRNLAGEVHQALESYRAALARAEVARRAIESAAENVKLTQQKYNVGSATILDLIDAQVQLQRARSDDVAARASMRVAEAQIDRVRGKTE